MDYKKAFKALLDLIEYENNDSDILYSLKYDDIFKYKLIHKGISKDYKDKLKLVKKAYLSLL